MLYLPCISNFKFPIKICFVLFSRILIKLWSLFPLMALRSILGDFFLIFWKKAFKNFYRTLEDIVPVSCFKGSTSIAVSPISVIAWDWKHLQVPGYILRWPTSLKTLFLKYTAKLRFFRYWGEQNQFYETCTLHLRSTIWKLFGRENSKRGVQTYVLLVVILFLLFNRYFHLINYLVEAWQFRQLIRDRIPTRKISFQ